MHQDCGQGGRRDHCVSGGVDFVVKICGWLETLAIYTNFSESLYTKSMTYIGYGEKRELKVLKSYLT